MMNKRTPLISILKNNLSHHHKKCWFILSIFIVGIISGSLFTSFSTLDQTKKYTDVFLTSFPLQGVSKTEIFKLSLINQLKLFFFLFLSGWHIFLFPVGLLQIFLKGFRLGFTISGLLKFYHFRGFLLSFFALFPQNLLLLPAILFFAVYQMIFLFEERTPFLKKQLHLKKGPCLKNLFVSFTILFFLLLSALIEGYFIPSTLQFFRNFFTS